MNDNMKNEALKNDADKLYQEAATIEHEIGAARDAGKITQDNYRRYEVMRARADWLRKEADKIMRKIDGENVRLPHGIGQ